MIKTVKSPKNLIIENLNSIDDTDCIIAVKGLPLQLIKDSLDENLLEEDFFSNGYIDFDQMNSTEGKAFLVRNMMTPHGGRRILAYETLLYAHRLSKEIGVQDKMIIIDFNLHPFAYPALPADKVPIIEDLNETTEGVLDSIYTSLYASAIKANGQTLVQFRDQELMDNAEVFKVFEVVNWEFKDLQAVEESLIMEKDLLFNYESREYVSYLDDILRGKRQEQNLKIFVENSVQADRVAQEQLGRIIDFLHKTGIEVELFKVKYDLTKSARPELQSLLKEVWNYDSFRSLKIYADPEVSKETMEISQAEIIETIVEQYEKANAGGSFDDIFLTAPTGGGKSLMFQLPAIYLGERYNALSIVVTPLISLMVDQVDNLRATGYSKVAYINSNISIIQREEIYEQIRNREIDLLYLAPELLLSYDISHFLQERNLGLYIIDEAHTVTTWGRDFRVDYWYLGSHINKVRKYATDKDGKKLKFPVVAVTATAPYNGVHDVVFETLNSLKMISAKKYIGYVRRENIEFNINHVSIDGNLQNKKVDLSVTRIKEFNKKYRKAIVYCPYRRQVSEVNRQAKKEGLESEMYHGQMEGEAKDRAYNSFKNNEVKVMVATKAFGMGVDIADIDLVYHLAPTGLLTDYVQEIGRAARDKDIQGEALVDYSIRDFQFINQLHGLNRTHDWQLREVMRRLWNFYRENERQNQLVSAEDFAYIFNDEDESKLSNNVKNALMLLEKDLNKKSGNIPVLIARPKNLFARVYACIRNEEISAFEKKVSGDSYKIVDYPNYRENGKSVVELELNEIWEENFSDKSFGDIKRKFFQNSLFEGIDLSPKLKIQLNLENSPELTVQELRDHFNVLRTAFNELAGHFFTKKEFAIKLIQLTNNIEWSKRIADFVLPLFSQKRSGADPYLDVNDVREYSNFLQHRREGEEIKYRVVDGAMNRLFAQIRTTVRDHFGTSQTTVKYVDNDGPYKHLYVKVGQILEILELGGYEVSGGENPKIYVRINDPFRLRQEAFGNYRNSLLQNIRDRHEFGVNLMKEFFEADLTSNQRWDFIEDYFLGKKQ